MTAQDKPQTPGRAPALQAVLAALPAAFAGSDLTDAGRLALDKALARLVRTGTAADAGAGDDLPVVAAQFGAALDALRGHGAALAGLAAALAQLAPDLRWTTRKSVGPTASPGFAEAHANAMLIGPGGVEAREDVWLGLSLMAPGTRYPDHDHPPEEVYLVLSEGAFWQEGAEWRPRSPGQTVYNPPGIRHAMRAGEAPFLALWCLPV